MNFLTVSNVDGVSSTQVRVTVIPNSFDIIPVRNQILELDLVNTTITGSVDDHWINWNRLYNDSE